MRGPTSLLSALALILSCAAAALAQDGGGVQVRLEGGLGLTQARAERNAFAQSPVAFGAGASAGITRAVRVRLDTEYFRYPPVRDLTSDPELRITPDPSHVAVALAGLEVRAPLESHWEPFALAGIGLAQARIGDLHLYDMNLGSSVEAGPRFSRVVYALGAGLRRLTSGHWPGVEASVHWLRVPDGPRGTNIVPVTIGLIFG